jgi:hypothetical protein
MAKGFRLESCGFAGWDKNGGHGSLGLGHSGVSSKAVYLIAREFGLRPFASNHNCPSCGVHFDRVLKGCVQRKEEELLQHFYNVIVGMLIVVQQYDVEQPCVLLSRLAARLRSYRGGNSGALHDAVMILLEHSNGILRKQKQSRGNDVPSS